MKKRKSQQQKRALIPQFEPIEKPISVFISSAQREFEKLRKDLKTAIHDITLGYTRPFHATLVETLHGDKINRDIQEGLEECDIYILLIGNQESAITQEEFLTAWERGIPVLVYVFLKPKSIDVKSPKCPTHDFLYKEILPKKIRVRGLDKPYRNIITLSTDVYADLASMVTKMVHESVSVRKTIGR